MGSMSTPAGWEPYRSPKQRAGADAFHLSPFARLARTHVLVAAADALVTIALANSLFFDLDPNDARWKVFLYLALTMAPLAVVAPFIGPALDRSVGGRRWMLIGVTAGRALVCFVMIDDLQGLLLFPEAFAVLAMGKAYAVSRSAIVPTVVRDDAELVEANSKLQLLSGLAVPLAAIPAAHRLRHRRLRGRAGGRGGRLPGRHPRGAPHPADPGRGRRRPPRRSRPSCTARASASRRRRWGSCAASSASSRSCCSSTCATNPPGRSARCSLLSGAGALVGSALAPVAAPRRSPRSGC